MKGTNFLATINDLISIFIPASTLSVSNNGKGVAELQETTSIPNPDRVPCQGLASVQARCGRLAERLKVLRYFRCPRLKYKDN